WLFLTGEEKAIYHLVEKGFFQGVKRDPKGTIGTDVDHSFRLVVVDRRGGIRGYADGRKADELDRLEARVRELSGNDQPAPTTPLPAPVSVFPAVNAGLNATCGLLLLLGFLAVRSHWITFHKVCMLSALAVSAVFLGCYLYYHFVVRNGTPTAFT